MWSCHDFGFHRYLSVHKIFSLIWLVELSETSNRKILIVEIIQEEFSGDKQREKEDERITCGQQFLIFVSSSLADFLHDLGHATYLFCA